VRWGWGVTLTVCLLSRVGWYFLAQLIANKTGLNLPVSEAAADHWFTWALGALSVEAFFGQLRLPAWSRNAWLGGSLLALGIAMSLLLPSIHNLVLHDLVWLFLHPVWGTGFFVLVNRAILAEKTWSSKLSTPGIVRVLAIVGLISYSLYLTHELVIMQSWRFGTWVHFPLLNALIVIVPLTILAAFLFFLLFERPYIRKAVAKPAQPLPQPQPELFAQAVNQVEA